MVEREYTNCDRRGDNNKPIRWTNSDLVDQISPMRVSRLWSTTVGKVKTCEFYRAISILVGSSDKISK